MAFLNQMAACANIKNFRKVGGGNNVIRIVKYV